jgi:hypothetical protein
MGWLARRWQEVVGGNGTSTADATGNVHAGNTAQQPIRQLIASGKRWRKLGFA